MAYGPIKAGEALNPRGRVDLSGAEILSSSELLIGAVAAHEDRIDSFILCAERTAIAVLLDGWPTPEPVRQRLATLYEEKGWTVTYNLSSVANATVIHLSPKGLK